MNPLSLGMPLQCISSTPEAERLLQTECMLQIERVITKLQSMPCFVNKMIQSEGSSNWKLTQAREGHTNTIEQACDDDIVQEVKNILRSYKELQDIVGILGVDDLSSGDKCLISRAKKLDEFLSSRQLTNTGLDKASEEIRQKVLAILCDHYDHVQTLPPRS